MSPRALPSDGRSVIGVGASESRQGATSSEPSIIRTAPTHFPEESADSLDRTTEEIFLTYPLWPDVSLCTSLFYILYMGGNVTGFNLMLTPAREYATL
jgi:hypothetical protein